MKKSLYVLMAVLMTAGFAQMSVAAPKWKAAKKDSKAAVTESTSTPKAEEKKAETKSATGFAPVIVYADQGSRDNHFAPSGWMGDYGDINIRQNWAENPHSGKSCIKITYSGKMSQGAGWTGMYWQQPANNWGDKKGGLNLTGAKKLTFWARGEKGGEKISEFKMGGITGEYPDSDAAAMGPVELTNEWKQYEIDLTDKDLSHVIGGFCWAASRDENPDGFTIYLDDIQYE